MIPSKDGTSCGDPVWVGTSYGEDIFATIVILHFATKTLNTKVQEGIF